MTFVEMGMAILFAWQVMIIIFVSLAPIVFLIFFVPWLIDKLKK